MMMIITNQTCIGCLIGNTFSRQDADDDHEVDDDHDADVDVNENVVDDDHDDCCQIKHFLLPVVKMITMMKLMMMTKMVSCKR